MGGDEEDWEENQEARQLDLDFLDHLSLICTKQGNTSSLVNIHLHPHHLKGAKRLEHVADDEEDVGDAQGAEEPVEEGRHRPEC